jgi:GxxExxY protein
MSEVGVLSRIHVRAHQGWDVDTPVGIFRADILVEDLVLLELKARSDLFQVHEAHLLNFLRATPIEVGLLLNFGPEPQFKGLVFSNNRKKAPVPDRH